MPIIKTIKHRCGHSRERVLTTFDARTGTPRILHDGEDAETVAAAVKHWESRACRDCWDMAYVTGKESDSDRR